MGAALGLRRAVRPGGGRVRVQRATVCRADDVLDVLAELVAQVGAGRARRRAAGVALPDAGHGPRVRRASGWRRRATRRGCAAGTATGTWAWPPGASSTGSAPRQAEVAARVEAELPNLRLRAGVLPRPSRARTQLGPVPGGHPVVLLGRAAAGSRRAGTGWSAALRAGRPSHDRGPRRRRCGCSAMWRSSRATRCPRWPALQECRDEAERSGERRRRWRTRCTGTAAWPWSRTTCRAPRRCCATALDRYQRDRRAEQQRADGAGRAGDGAWPSRAICRDAVRLCEDVRRDLRGPRRALGAGLRAVRAGVRGLAGGEPARARRLARGVRWPSTTPSTTCSARCWRWNCWRWSPRARATPARGRGAAGRGGADVAVGGPAAVRLGVLQRAARRCARRGAAALGDAAVRGVRRRGARGWAGTRRWRGRWSGRAAARAARRPRRRRDAGAADARSPPPRPRKGGETAG